MQTITDEEYERPLAFKLPGGSGSCMIMVLSQRIPLNYEGIVSITNPADYEGEGDPMRTVNSQETGKSERHLRLIPCYAR